MSVNRRDFLRSVPGISGATIASAVVLDQTEQVEQLDAALPNPEQSGIEHVVVVMMLGGVRSLQEGCLVEQIPPLRFAPLGMTSHRVMSFVTEAKRDQPIQQMQVYRRCRFIWQMQALPPEHLATIR
jgi:hypothetical protein